LVYSRPPAVNDTREQSPETATLLTSALSWPRPPGDTRCTSRPGALTMNASARPLVSPGTRLLAREMNAMQRPACRKSPLTTALPDAPFATPPPRGRETSRASLPRHGVPWLLIEPLRRTTKMSFCPFVSPRTRLVAVDSNAISRA
jgi:hypothetical protein